MIILGKRYLVSERHIAALSKKHPVMENDFKEAVRRFNLREALIEIGKASVAIQSEDSPYSIGQTLIKDPSTGVIVSQHSLAYLANIFLISGANDYRDKVLKARDDLLSLCNIYHNSTIEPLLQEDDGASDQDKLSSFLIRTHYEQMELQFSPAYMIARAVLLFNELASRVSPTKFSLLNDIFYKETGISIFDYLRLGAIFVAHLSTIPTLNMRNFTTAIIPQLKLRLDEDKVSLFINILSADYQRFRSTDKQFNKGLDPRYTKSRFNTLYIYPIVECDAKHYGDRYIVPNLLIFIYRVYAGLYWWFHRHFEQSETHLDFRQYFGDIFQEYAGLVLKDIFRGKEVHGEIAYGSSQKFLDWWIDLGDKIYLFETKAYQLTLKEKQTGERETALKGVARKIAEAIAQVYMRFSDIEIYEELAVFRNRKIVPFILLYNIPFPFSPIYRAWIEEELKEIELQENMPGLKGFFSSVFLLNIDELEAYDMAFGKIDLEGVFPKFEGSLGDGFAGILRKETGIEILRNRLLESTYERFWDELIEKDML